ncbi:hypothetical protein WJX81_001668 [Elliptochloris bilobata]|uniref:Enoyl reductase (ER) domain-containing protein n=1 Tax=Elliptochloris bilobata TaxID=381761 RepID=A0AAW1SIE7_9CHLO
MKQTAAAVLDASRKGRQGAITILRDHPVKEPKEDEVLVKVLLRPIHPVDIKTLSLTYPGFDSRYLPAVVGSEGVGKVARNGVRASKFAEGMRVVAVPWPTGTANGGTWQQYVSVPEANLVAVPDAVPDEAAAQFFLNPATAYGFLEVLQVQELLDVGADAVICTEDEDVVSRVQDITGGELAYGAVDPVAGAMTRTLAAATRAGGTVYVYGSLGGAESTVALMDLVYRGVTLKGFWLFPWLKSLSNEQRAEVLQQLMRLVAEGVVAPHSGKRFPLEQAGEAVQASQAPGRASEGKFFLEG